MSGPVSTFAAASGGTSVLEEELMDFESAAAHFALGADEWGLSELDEEALQGIVQGRCSSNNNTTTTSSTPPSQGGGNNTNGSRTNNNNSLKLTSSTRLSSTTMKIDTSDTNDIFGCVRFGSGNSFGTNKGRPSMISAKYRLKEERRKVLKISIGKLKRIEDPESSLCRSVLINNTMKRLQREAREEKLQRQGIYPQQTTPPTHVAFERSPVDDLKPMVSIEPVPRSAVTLSVSNPCSSPAAAPASDSPSAACSVTITSSTTTAACTTTVASAASRKRSTSDVECDECDVQDVLSHFYMPPTPRLLTSIDDEDEVVPPKRQRLMETTETNNNNNTSVQLSPSIEQLPSSLSNSSTTTSSPPAPPTPACTDDVSTTPCATERLQSELCTGDVKALNSRSADETEQMDTSIIHERLTQLSEEEDDEDEVIDVVNETSSPTFDSSAAAEFCRTSNEIIRMDAVSEVLSSNRIRDFSDESTRYPSQRANSLSVSQSNQVTNVGVNSSNSNPCSSSNINSSSATSVLDANEQQHFSCGHSSIFGELQSVVFHSLIASLES